MPAFGYTLSSEETEPRRLVELAQRAERAGFTFAGISDHFHPWIDRQGQSPFVWSVLGAVAQATERLRVFTGVTCPIMRMHPANVAHAAATTAALMPGRFQLGLGSGENLNEHIVGERWPSADERIEMLAEAIDIIRWLWTGRLVSHRGTHFRVEDARLYTLPEEPTPIYVAVSGTSSAELAARCDGMIGTQPDRELIEHFDASGGNGKPRIAQVTVCYAPSEDEARRIALEWWPIKGLKGAMKSELPLPAHFEQASEIVREDDITNYIACGPDPEVHLDMIRRYTDAGYDHVYLHAVGPDQDGFFRFYEQQVLPKL